MNVPPGSDTGALAADAQAQLARQLDEQLALPPLREDLVLHAGATLKDGAPSWVIEDPLRGKFFRIGWLEFEVLTRWHLGDVRAVAEKVAGQTPLRPSIEEVLSVKLFFLQHELLVNPELINRVASGERRHASLATRALHNYLMLRIPLVNPDPLLARLLPWFQPLLGPKAFALSAAAALIGWLLALQQWDTFTTTFLETLSVQGLLSYSAALVLAKVLHEFGHAFTAKSLGLRVPRMGVAFVVLFPMLYTDTGETWRLKRRRDRFRIAFAGMRIELMLAAWCTLAWSFLPDGALRSAMFFLATTSWIMTLAVNASPFLRFDGYYMMSDATGIPNLHDVAGQVVRTGLRKRLLGIDEPVPTIEGDAPPPWMLWFGVGTLVYRFFLFLGIAVTVYHYFFKALGVFLFAVEIWWFILKPVVSELLAWWKDRKRIQTWPATRTGLVLAASLLALALPWQSRIHAEGWVRAGQEFAVYSPRPARLLQAPVAGHTGGQDLLAGLQSPELALREAQAVARMSTLDSRLSASSVTDQHAESMRSTREQLSQQLVEYQGADTEARQLRLMAPFQGQVVDVSPELQPGVVVARQQVLARLIDPQQWIAEVFIDEDDVKRVHLGAQVRAYLHGSTMEVVDGRVDQVDTVPLDQLPAEMLAARHGGWLITTDDPNQLKPRHALYRVRVALAHGPATPQARLAAFGIAGDRVSLIGRWLRGIASSLVLQASF